MRNYRNAIFTFMITVLLSACAMDGGQSEVKTSASGVQTEKMAAVSATGDAAASLTIRTVTATVKDIDLPSRMVTIVGPDGKSFVMHASEQVRNLAQVKAGDKVTVEYTDGIAAEIVAPGSSKEMTITDAMARAAPGQRPAGVAGKAVTAMVVIELVDIERNTVQFKNNKGVTQVVAVRKPEFRAMLKNLKPGDQVAITYFEAAAISVQPASK